MPDIITGSIGSTGRGSDAADKDIDEVCVYIGRRRPSCFVFDVGDCMLKVLLASGASRLEMFVERARAVGYAVRTVDAGHAAFAEMPTKRWHIVGMSPSCGGEASLDWAVATMHSVVRHREAASAPTNVWTIVDPHEPLEIERVARGKDHTGNEIDGC